MQPWDNNSVDVISHSFLHSVDLMYHSEAEDNPRDAADPLQLVRIGNAPNPSAPPPVRGRGCWPHSPDRTMCPFSLVGGRPSNAPASSAPLPGRGGTCQAIRRRAYWPCFLPGQISSTPSTLMFPHSLAINPYQSPRCPPPHEVPNELSPYNMPNAPP